MTGSIFLDKITVLTAGGLDAAALRQRTIAHNIANINTPGFKRMEVRFEDQLEKALSGSASAELAATNQRHISGKITSETKPQVVKIRGTTQRQDGNNVNLEVEMGSMVMNTVRYYALIQQLNDRLGNLGYVINEGRG